MILYNSFKRGLNMNDVSKWLVVMLVSATIAFAYGAGWRLGVARGRTLDLAKTNAAARMEVCQEALTGYKNLGYVWGKSIQGRLDCVVWGDTVKIKQTATPDLEDHWMNIDLTHFEYITPPW
jgi:hypothetical protein